MPKKVLILVEGATEDSFIKKVLKPYLAEKEIFIIPTIIVTKENIKGPDYKGGITSYRQVKTELDKLLRDSSADIVTTMIDYYAVPGNFPGFHDRPAGTCYQRVEFMEQKFGEDINHPKFIPYLQLHETETFVFASAKHLSTAFINQHSKIRQVETINANFISPEEINENYDTAPSRRLINIFPEYRKTFHSQLILAQTNIEDLKSKCPHFSDWINKIEA